MARVRRARRASPTLPDEIIADEILKRLPVEFVVRFRSVSKLWNFLLSQPNYIQPLLNHSISQNFNDDYLIFSTRKSDGIHRISDGISILSHSNSSEICLDNVPYPVCKRDLVHMVGSINGLVCLSCRVPTDSVYHFILWNPVMNLSKKILLPNDFPTKLKGDKRFMLGFGLDSVTNNYKIIVQCTDWDSVQAVEAVVYSSETDSWINIVGSKFSQHIFTGLRCWLPSVIVKGICYWDNCGIQASNQALKFEPKNNEVTYFTVPHFRHSYTLVNMNDCLARVDYALIGEDIMDVYFFNEECCTWSKIYTTNTGIYDIKIIKPCFRNGRMVVFHAKRQEYSFYDPKSNETKGLACSYDKKDLYYFGKGFSYTPSLVALAGMKSLHP